MVDQDARRELIRQQVTDLAIAEGGHAEINEDLLEEVNYLVEWPTALCGKFEENSLLCRRNASSPRCESISVTSRYWQRTAPC